MKLRAKSLLIEAELRRVGPFTLYWKGKRRYPPRRPQPMKIVAGSGLKERVIGEIGLDPAEHLLFREEGDSAFIGHFVRYRPWVQNRKAKKSVSSLR